jgi:hypothetical protein
MMNHDKVFQHLSWDQIYTILDEVFNLISDSDTQLSIIAVLIDKAKLKKSIDIETWAYRLLFERVNRFIGRQAQSLMEEEHPPQYGIMIMDSEGMTKDQKLRKRLVNILRNGTLYSQLDYLIEDPLFTDSKWRNLSQLADCVAYCIRKNHRNNSSTFHTGKWQSYYNKIESKFDCPFGSYKRYGLKIFP